MPLFWFLAGILTTLAAVILILPWLRSAPRLASLPRWQGVMLAGVLVAAAFGLSRWQGHAASPIAPIAGAARGLPGAPASPFAAATKVFDQATAPPGKAGAGAAAAPAASANAGSMESAIASLEARLAKGGGSADDWELLAKSFEFLGRPEDAAKARANQLPSMAAGAATAAAGASVSGEVTLAAALGAKAAPGDTLFIVAKSVDSPGIPVAVFRGSVGGWPLKFTLDDSQSMLPGRNLSSAGKVTIEARISKKGQPLAAPGDLQGSSGVINPADHRPLKIQIDRVIT